MTSPLWKLSRQVREHLAMSANFTEAAQERNIEVGVWIEDRALSQMLVRQFEGLVAAKQLVRVPGI